jgi:hypothetical protein
MSSRKIKRQREAGVVLLIAIFVLMLVSVVAIALIVSSGTESALAANYRSSAAVYYAAMAGLEEARGRLQPNIPDYFNNSIAGFMPTGATPLATGSVRYVINPVGGETVDPRDSASPYFDAEYQTEFGIPITSAPDVQLINSVSGNNGAGIPGPPFKWVRITAATKNSLKMNVDGAGSANGNTLLYYDPQRKDAYGTSKPSLIVSNSSATAVQAFTLTALAALPNGSQKMLQYVVAQNAFSLQVPAALTLVGNSVVFHPPSPSTFFFANGQDQFDVGTCHAGASSVYGVGYANLGDAGNVTSATTGFAGHYIGYGGASPNVGWVGNTTNPPPNLAPNQMNSADLEALVQTRIALTPNAAIVTPPSGIAHNHDLPPTSAANPRTIVVNGDLDTTTDAGPNLWAGGYGLLVVTGTFTYQSLDSGGQPARWHGIVLVIGQGKFVVPNSGSGEIEGALFIATTRDSSGAVLPTNGSGTPDSGLGQATFEAATGGLNGVLYSNCWIKAVLPLSNYRVLSFREVPQ